MDGWRDENKSGSSPLGMAAGVAILISAAAVQFITYTYQVYALIAESGE